MKPISEARAGHPLYAADINAQSSELRRQGNVSFEGGTVNSEGGGVHISVDGTKGFWARLQARDGFKYGWYSVEKVVENYGWNFPVFDEIAYNSSTPFDNYAIEVNRNIGVPFGTVVWLEPISNQVDGTESKTIYVFQFNEFGGSATVQSVVTNVLCDSNGINLTKHNFAAYDYKAPFSPTFLSNTDVIPKSYSGQSGKVVTVNFAETGLEFGAAVEGASGLGSINADIVAILTSIAELTTIITNLQASINSMQTRISNLEAG